MKYNTKLLDKQIITPQNSSIRQFVNSKGELSLNKNQTYRIFSQFLRPRVPLCSCGFLILNSGVGGNYVRK